VTQIKEAKLTPAEMRVFDMLVYGLTSKEIASRIGCSFRTIHIHRSNIMNKTGANNGGTLIRMSMTKQIRKRIDAIEKAVVWGKTAEALAEIRNINAFLGDKK